MKSKQLLMLVVAAVVVAGGAFLALRGDSDEATSINSETSQTDSSDKSEAEDHHDEMVSLPEQTVGGPVDCSLYSLEELSGVWGVTLTDTDEENKVISTSDDGKLYSCGYHETDSGKGVSFTIEFREYQSIEKAETDMKNVRDGAKIQDKVYFVNDEVDGIGDEAFFSKTANTESIIYKSEEQLYARHHNVVYLISAVNLDGVDSTYRDKILASYRLHLDH